MPQSFFQRLHDLLTVAALVHINKVDNDDATQVAQPNLPHDLFDGINVGFHNGVFQPRRLANELARINVDGNQRFRLIDDDIAAALQPYFRLESFINLFGQPELLKQRNLFGVKLYTPDQRRLETVKLYTKEIPLFEQFGLTEE